MKTKSMSKEEMYVSPEMETLQISLGTTVMQTSCTENQMEPITCNPDEELDW